MAPGALSVLESQSSITGELQIHGESLFGNVWVGTDRGNYPCDVLAESSCVQCLSRETGEADPGGDGLSGGWRRVGVGGTFILR